MSQSRRHSLLESLCNITLGYALNFSLQLFLYRWFGFHVTLRANVEISLVFTAASLLRSYVLRRMFNWFASFRIITASGRMETRT